MMDDNLIPITDEQAKLGQEIVIAFRGLGSFLQEALGSTPRDLIAYLGGDWLRFRRAENIAMMMKRTQDRLKECGVTDPEPASLTLALPILRGAADENREELQNLWARLMAAALDPLKSSRVRQGFAEVISKMDPADALVLSFMKDKRLNEYHYDGGQQHKEYAFDLKITPDEFEASIWTLQKLELIALKGNFHTLTAFARELLRVVSD